MAKLFKSLLILIAVIILLLTITIGGVMIFINPNDYKATISNQVYKMTGRTLTIQGDIKWSFVPWVGLEVNNVTLSNAPGFGDKPFAQLGRAQATIKLLPLIKGEIEAGNLTLKNVTINLTKNTHGKTNWDDMMKNDASNTTASTSTTVSTNAKTPSQVATKQKNKPLPAFLLSSISIIDATINMKDAQQQTNNSYTINELDSKNINIKGSQFPVTLIVSMKNATTNQTINTKLKSNVRIDTKKQTAKLSDFSLIINNMQLKGDLTASDILSDKLAYQTTVKLTSFNANSFIKSLDSAVQFKQPSALQTVSASATISGTANSINVSQLTAKVDKTTINATANLSNIKRLIGDYTLSLDKINLDNYQTVSTQQKTVSQSTQSSNNTSNNQTAVKAAKTKPATYQVPFIHSNLNGTITANALTVNKITLTNIKSDASLQQGVINIGPVTADVYGGQLRANIIANYTQPTPSYIVTETLNGVQIKSLITAMQGQSRISGTANVNANITAKGKDNTAILRSLNGNAGFSINNGQIQGFQVMQALNTAASTFFRQPGNNTGSNTTTFANTAATFSIKKGVASTNDLILNASALKVTGDGSIDLVTQRLNMSLDVSTTANIIPAVANLQKQIGGSIPLNVGGTLSNPQISPDMQKITIEATKQKIGDQVDKLGKDLDKSSKDLGKQLKSLFN